MKKLMFAIVAMMSLVSSVAYAGGTWTNVTVTQVSPCSPQSSTCGTNGYVQVQFSAGSTGSPSCAGSLNNYAIIDIANAAGGALFNVLMSARLSGQTISASGTGGCNLKSSVETLYTVGL
jgi:phage-related tail fiber protein